MSDHPLRIFSGSAHPALAKEIASLLNVELGKAATSLFPDSEIHVEIDEAVRDQDIFFIQPCPPPVNNYLIELFFSWMPFAGPVHIQSVWSSHIFHMPGRIA